MRSGLIDFMHGLIAAVQFLTRIPLPIHITYTRQVFQRSIPFFPLAGFVIGGLLAGLAILSTTLLPSLPAAVLIVIGWTALTGGLHLDGLIDTADGIFSYRSREKMLEIMKDSRVGAMGVIAGMLYLLLKTALIYELLRYELAETIVFWLTIPVWSRWYMTVAIAGWKYARDNGGLGQFFQQMPRRFLVYSTGVSLLLTVLATYIHKLTSLSDLIDVLPVLFVVGGMTVVGLLVSIYLARKLGGLTGDTYGALNEWLEAVGLCIGVSMLHLGI